MREGEIRGLLSICNNNLMVSLPDTNEGRRSLEGLDFYVCIDFFMSEGSRYADVVLPGSTWSEDEGVTANGEGRVVKINKSLDRNADSVLFNLFFGFHVVDNRRARSTLTFGVTY